MALLPPGQAPNDETRWTETNLGMIGLTHSNRLRSDFRKNAPLSPDPLMILAGGRRAEREMPSGLGR